MFHGEFGGPRCRDQACNRRRIATPGPSSSRRARPPFWVFCVKYFTQKVCSIQNTFEKWLTASERGADTPAKGSDHGYERAKYRSLAAAVCRVNWRRHQRCCCSPPVLGPSRLDSCPG